MRRPARLPHSMPCVGLAGCVCGLGKKALPPRDSLNLEDTELAAVPLWVGICGRAVGLVFVLQKWGRGVGRLGVFKIKKKRKVKD